MLVDGSREVTPLRYSFVASVYQTDDPIVNLPQQEISSEALFCCAHGIAHAVVAGA